MEILHQIHSRAVHSRKKLSVIDHSLIQARLAKVEEQISDLQCFVALDNSDQLEDSHIFFVKIMQVETNMQMTWNLINKFSYQINSDSVYRKRLKICEQKLDEIKSAPYR